MDFETYLMSRIKEMKEKYRLTDKEIGARAGFSQAHANRLINGEQPIGGVSLSNILNLFPEVRRVLEDHFCRGGGGSSIVSTVSGNGNNSAVNGDIHIFTGGRLHTQQLIDELSRRIIMSDVCSDEKKVAAIKTIMLFAEEAKDKPKAQQPQDQPEPAARS